MIFYTCGSAASFELTDRFISSAAAAVFLSSLFVIDHLQSKMKSDPFLVPSQWAFRRPVVSIDRPQIRLPCRPIVQYANLISWHHFRLQNLFIHVVTWERKRERVSEKKINYTSAPNDEWCVQGVRDLLINSTNPIIITAAMYHFSACVCVFFSLSLSDSFYMECYI